MYRTLLLAVLTAFVATAAFAHDSSPASDAANAELFKLYAFELAAANNEGFSSLGEIALSMVKALEANDQEAYAGAKAIYQFRIGQMPLKLRTALEKFQTDLSDTSARAFEKHNCGGGGGGGGGGATCDPPCKTVCWPTGGLCTSNGCACY